MRKLLLVFLTILAFLLLDFSSVLSQDIKIGTGRAKRVLFIGDSISIWWSVENATKFSCAELEEFDLPMEGKLFVSQKQSTNYVFVAERGKSSKSKRIAIEVVHPEIVNFNVPANIT
ncbi:MAG: hypothetical protein GX879_02150, partial [Bacteroidales bacterium]|nr:hypothetical protein [Bacteroidales bacterium]